MTEKEARVVTGFIMDVETKMVSIYRKAYRDGFDEGHRIGLEDGEKYAWSVLRKMADAHYDDFREIFGDMSLADVIRNMNAAEAIERFDSYNLCPLAVGDIVEDSNGYKAVVTNIGTHIHLLYISNGKTWKAKRNTKLTKVGRCESPIFKEEK